jgi:hypothetical protein
MIRTVTALFDDTGEAETAFDTLSRRVAVLKGTIVTCGPGEKPDFGTVYLSRSQREACEAELKDGGSLLIVQVEGDAAAEQAVGLLDRHADDDVPEPRPIAAPVPTFAPKPARPAPLPSPAAGTVEGLPISTLSRKAPIPATPIPAAAVDAVPEREVEPEPPVVAEEHIPVVEEELRVGKRTMVRGGARVHAFMEEVPVVETIELLEEQTTIERRPVNRRLSEEEIVASGLLQDRVIEVAEMREEAVVTKEAFVREELVVKKTVEKRIEQINDTVRRTAVEMERLEPELAGADEGARSRS